MTTLAEHPQVSHIRPVPPQDLAGDAVQPGHPLFGVVWINPGRLGGTPCFYGTRVPVKNLFDYLQSGLTLDAFLDDFDGVTREQATAVIELARRDLLAELPKP